LRENPVPEGRLIVKIPFNKPFLTGRELEYISRAHSFGQLSGNGPFTKQCQTWLEEHTGCRRALLTHSCTGALEMAAILADIKAGDEIIMPSYTFVSTANAFVLRGGVPVFVDIRSDTLNIDETRIEPAITARTRAVVPVHYAGVACEMDTVMAVAKRHGLLVIEDAAQGILSSYKGLSLGGIGHLGVYSFHETKNIISGEGGSLLINDGRFNELAEIVWEKGTDRSRFFRGQVDKYTWQHIGSSYLPGEIISAFLWAQLEQAEILKARRLEIWGEYHRGFEDMEKDGLLRRPAVPSGCHHNSHMYYIILPDFSTRDRLLKTLNGRGVNAIFHYIPLHSSPAGRKYGRVCGDMEVTDSMSGRILRLPLWVGMGRSEISEVISAVSYGLRHG
jgi:dTDP-4-amino-4,6-dideoxygalactose transaminase